MAHYTQHQFARWVKESFPEFFRNKSVLEVGSLDINGSVRDLFTDCQYTGLDVAAGPGVDVVCGGHEFAAPDASFDVVCSFEAMEHNPFWEKTFENMIRLVKPGGLVIMSCATLGRPEHGTSRSKPQDSPLTTSLGWDYYRNLSSVDFEKSFKMSEAFSTHFFAHYFYGCDLFFFGFRSGGSEPANVQHVKRTMRFRYLVRNLLNREALTMMLSAKLGRVK